MSPQSTTPAAQAHPSDSTPTEKTYPGLVIRSHCVRDASSKSAASTSLKDWQAVEQTAPVWVSELEQGHTIQPSLFVKSPDDTYTHAKEYWQGTHFVCADADHIRGVEFNTDTGADVNPDGVDAWQADKQLCVLYPALKDDCYAALQSVSSMTHDKPPPHRRYRLIFVFDEMIESVDHYSQILCTLSERYPIIPSIERAPSQPVFGNAKETGKAVITGNVLSLSAFPYISPEKPAPASLTDGTYNGTQRKYRHELDGLIADAKLTRHETGGDGTVRVDCPFNSDHNRDAFVGLDDGGYPYFKCHHNSCQGNGFNEMAKLTGVAVVEVPQQHDQKPVVMLSEVTEVDGEAAIMPKVRDVVSDAVSEHLWDSEWIYRRGIFLGTLRRGEDAPVFVKSENVVDRR